MSIVRTFILDRNEASLVIVDIQERLCRAMDQKILGRLVRNVGILQSAAGELGIPVIGTEQYVKGLGELLPEIRGELTAPPIEKQTFSCCGEPRFLSRLEELGRRQLIVVGMEAHICVLQTVVELIANGYVVHLVRDAVMSRRKENWEAGVEVARSAGAVITTTEAALFQLLRTAGTPEFRKLSPLVKEG